MRGRAGPWSVPERDSGRNGRTQGTQLETTIRRRIELSVWGLRSSPASAGGTAQIAPAYSLRDSRGPTIGITSEGSWRSRRYLDTSQNHTSERNIVVRDRTCRGAGRGAGRSSSLRGGGTTRATAFACAAQHDHVSRANLRGLAFVAFLVVPFTRLKAAFDVDQAAFCQVLVADLGQTIPRHDAVPLGAFLALAGSFIVPYVIGGHREPAERDSACGVLEFRIAAEPPDENYFVNGLRHTDSCCTASALARAPRSRLQFFKLHLCTFSFTRIRKFFHNSFQSLDCLRCLIQFGEGEAFLVKGSTSFIVPGILLQEQIVVRYRLLVFLLVPERIGNS